jgi:hypothetical protein
MCPLVRVNEAAILEGSRMFPVSSRSRDYYQRSVMEETEPWDETTDEYDVNSSG